MERDNAAAEYVLECTQQRAERGGAAVRENPLRSLHWDCPTEQAMMETWQWWDRDYYACVFMGARCEAQRLRHNLQEIHDWPEANCHHLHDPHEWDPWRDPQSGSRVYSSHEEAEYSAGLAFSVAVAASWWAVRARVATLRVPRMPPLQTAGDRRSWLEFDPRTLREWAMAPLALMIGLRPPDPAEAATFRAGQ